MARRNMTKVEYDAFFTFLEETPDFAVTIHTWIVRSSCTSMRRILSPY